MSDLHTNCSREVTNSLLNVKMRDCISFGEESGSSIPPRCFFFFYVELKWLQNWHRTLRMTLPGSMRETLVHWWTSERRRQRGELMSDTCVVITPMMAATECTVAMATCWNNKHRPLFTFCLPTGQCVVSHQQRRTHTLKHKVTHTYRYKTLTVYK